MIKKIKPKTIDNSILGQFPHCDPKVLHAPGECQHCDKHPEWQALRQIWAIAFTGYDAQQGELPCPAENARGRANCQAWGGNKPKPELKHTHLGGLKPDCPAGEVNQGYFG